MKFRAVVLGVGVMLVMAGCGGESGEAGSDATTVSSPDGKAVLTLAAGSLPDGVTVDDLQIDWAEGLSDEPGAPGVGVRLSPDGLVLNEEATLRLELPNTMADHLVATHVTSNGFTLIGGEIEPVDGTRFFTTEVDHFSTVLITGVPGLITLIADATPNIVTVGQTQLVTSEVWIEPVPLILWIPTTNDGEKSQMYTFDGIRISTGAFVLHRGTVAWNDGKEDSKSWDPEVTGALETTDDVFVAFAASSTCKIVNSVDPWIVDHVEVTMTVTAVGAVADRAVMRFARLVGQEFEEGFSEHFDADRNTIPFSAAVGDTVKGNVFVMASVESECVASISETTTTVSATTSTTQPSSGGSTDLIDCPDGFDADDDEDRRPTGQGSSTDSSEAARDATNIVCLGGWEGSYIFTMIVAGDGEAMSTAATTKWYNPRFIVNADPDTGEFDDDRGFYVNVGWNNDGEPSGDVLDINFKRISDAVVDVVWLDSSTLQVTVEIPDRDVVMTRIKVELSARTKDLDGNTTGTYEDDAYWELDTG